LGWRTDKISLTAEWPLDGSFKVVRETPHDGLVPKEFVNGKWFTGEDFRDRTFYSVNGILTAGKPSGPIETVDLQGGFVVAPFGDAHNHFPSREQDLADGNRAHLEAGVFYTLNPGGDAEVANPIRARLGTPTTIDAIFAHGVFTCPGGHPEPLLEYFADRGDPFFDKARLEGRYFHSVSSIAQLEEVWPRFLSTSPEFVKLIFGFSEVYRSSDASQKSLGLRLEVVKEIVGKARVAGLRTGAHIENAEDFHNAIDGGVDMVMHLPIFPDSMGRKGARREPSLRKADYVIAASDAKLAADRGVSVVTTVATGSAEDFERPNPVMALNDNEKRFLGITLLNLQNLKDEGVTLVVGSDARPGAGTLSEINFLENTGVFSNLELLKMWSEATPKAIFPQRKVGKLEESHEANFLVLDGDPIQDFSMVKKIRTRVKRGYSLKWN
jgi:hypothetical protein